MNLKTLILLSLIAYTLIACDDGFLQEIETPPEEIPENTYPQKYVYTGVEFNSTEFFRYQVDSFEQFVPEEGELLLADSAIGYEYFADDALFVFALKEMELLSDTLARIRIEGEGYNTIDSTFNYRIENDLLLLNLFGGDILFGIDDERTQLKNCYQAVAYNYYNDIREKRTLSGLFGGPCSSRDKEQILNKVIEEHSGNISFQPNDTIVLNISHFLLELEE